MTDRKLSPQEAAFARAYVVTREAKAAAVKAGYSEKSAKVAGCRLLKRKHVRDEVSRLESLGQRAVNRLITDSAKTADRSLAVDSDGISAEIRAEIDKDLLAATTRAYILATVREYFEICAGRKQRTVTKFKRSKVGQVPESFEIKMFDPNPTAATAAAVLLLAQPEISGPKLQVAPQSDDHLEDLKNF